MAVFEPKSFQQIVAAMAAKMSAETPITDFNPGSVVLTLLEAAAQEDFQQYIQMLQIIRNYNLDTTEGEDLDNRAFEFGLTRLQPLPHSGFVTISDSRFTKISSKIYAGLAGPTATSLTINVDDASSFPATGSVYVGRNTTNSEGPITYSSAPVDNGAFWTITLDTALVNDHGTDETVVLAQFGDRVVDAGTEVKIPESDTSEEVIFELNQTVTLLDGEDEIDNVLVTALESGGFRVPANSIVQFPNSPFTGATVTNPLPFVNGRDEETDQALRDRIRDFVQSLSRGTGRSVRTSIIGLIDEDTNSSIVSANIVTPVILADGPSQVYIDNGRGLEPEFDSIGLESVLVAATGGERFFQLEQFPVVKASVVAQNTAPYSLSGTETIIVRVGTNEETFTFLSTDFELPGQAEATEVAEVINRRATLFEARTLDVNGSKSIILTPVARTNENMQVDSTSTAQTAMNFPTLEVNTLKLYKNDKLLVKDGRTASLLSSAQPFNLDSPIVTTTDGDITVTANSRIVSKSVAGTEPFDQLVHPGDYIKFSSDSDIFYTRVRTVVSETKFILEDTYPISGGGVGDISIWNSPQLEVAANGDRDETEIVSFAFGDFASPAQALATEVAARMQLEVNLSRVELAVNNTNVSVISDKENTVDSKMQILGGGAAVALGYCGTSSLTGTLTVAGGSKVVTGTGTAFLTELEEGQWIKIDSHGIGAWTKVESIEDNTTLYLTENYRGADATTAAASKIEFSELSEGADADYLLNRSNGQIELTDPLVEGDSLTAGSINTRAFVDSLQETFDFDSLGASSTLIVCIDGGFEEPVTTGDASAPYDTFRASNLIGFEPNFFDGFYLEWITGNNIGETSFVASYDESNGEIVTTSGFTNPVAVTDRFVLCQVLNFTHATDFSDPANVQAAEVITAINNQILGGIAEAKDLQVRLRTTNLTESGKIEIKGGSANNVLGFTTVAQESQLANLAFLQSQNSDREGNSDALGYTLGPDQNLVVIFDDDAANKTFAINSYVDGTVTGSTGANNMSDSNLQTDYDTNDFFNDFWVYWRSGANEGTVQTVTDYDGTTGAFTTTDVFGSSVGPSNGDEFVLVPRTAENVVRLLNDFNTTTLSIVGDAEVVGISGDFVQLATKQPGSIGKVFVTGGTANSLGIAVVAIAAGAPDNDLTTNSKSGLFKGLLTDLTVDGTVTTGDASIPFDTFIDTSMITTLPGYFTGLTLEFLTGDNAGATATISAYNNVTGEITLATAMTNAIDVGDTFRIHRDAFVSDIQGTTAPFTINFVDSGESNIDVSGYTAERGAAIRDKNGLNFSNIQVEGIDGYKHKTGLEQEAQWTIDGLDRDSSNYPGIGATGTQFEVLTPILKKIRLIIDVTPEQGVSLSSVSGPVSNAISEYINSRGVGDDVILSEIVAAAQSVTGVFDIEVSNQEENITVADGELARIDDADLIIG